MKRTPKLTDAQRLEAVQIVQEVHDLTLNFLHRLTEMQWAILENETKPRRSAKTIRMALMLGLIPNANVITLDPRPPLDSLTDEQLDYIRKRHTEKEESEEAGKAFHTTLKARTARRKGK